MALNYLVPRAFPLQFLREKPWGRGWALKIQRSIVFMKGPPCEAGAEQLKAQLSVLDEPTLPDPFQAITNSDIEEAGDENTMVLDEDSDVDIEL